MKESIWLITWKSSGSNRMQEKVVTTEAMQRVVVSDLKASGALLVVVEEFVKKGKGACYVQ